MSLYIRSIFANIRTRNYEYRSIAYKSAISLENLYPESNLKLSTPVKQTDKADKFSGYIPINQIQLTYSKSAGPGGQNVNKVNTKVDLRFHLESASWLKEDTRRKLASKLKTKITKDGFLVFRSDITRLQQLNVADCLEKLRCAIREAERDESVVNSETPERLRRRYEKAVAERLQIKRRHSQIKQDRRDPSIQDVA